MRQNQHNNKRMRGRNRKGPNPLSRNFESNGPDIKIRGNAAHIAEKYSSLARDAQVSGDRVLAESYLQHAEHYNRIIMTAQAQMQAQAEQQQAEQQQQQPQVDNRADNQDEENIAGENGSRRRKQDDASAEQPAVEAQANGSAPDGESGDDGDTDGGKPRGGRSRRGRRGPRVKADGDNGAGDDAQQSASAPDESAPEQLHS